MKATLKMNISQQTANMSGVTAIPTICLFYRAQLKFIRWLMANPKKKKQQQKLPKRQSVSYPMEGQMNCNWLGEICNIWNQL